MKGLKFVLILLISFCTKLAYSDIFEIKTVTPYDNKIEVDYLLSNNKKIEDYFNSDKFEKFRCDSEPEFNPEFSKFLESFIEGIKATSLDVRYIEKLKYLGKVGNAYMFEDTIEINEGAVHSQNGIGYILLTSSAKEIKLEDVIENTKKFDTLYSKYFKLGLKDISLFNQNEITKTTNFYFSSNGLKFVFQPYEIAPYSYGTPSFTIPYSVLKGVIKKEYILK